jgi:hypothetical protein
LLLIYEINLINLENNQVFEHHVEMHEFCCCVVLKVFKIICEKGCEKGVKGLI